jgi:hypothetical protein
MVTMVYRRKAFRVFCRELPEKSRLYSKSVEFLSHSAKFGDSNGLQLNHTQHPLIHNAAAAIHRPDMEVHGSNFRFVVAKWKFAARTYISSARNGSSRLELTFHRREMEVRSSNLHFIAVKWKFAARTYISSARNRSSRLELTFHRHEMELRGSNLHFIAAKWKFAARTYISSP